MTEQVHDYLIVGAGPAGLQLARQFDRAGHDYVVLEAGAVPGTFFTRFPRHRTLISVNKVHTGWTDPERNLRMDWNSLLADGDPDPLLFTSYSKEFFPPADVFVRYLADYAQRYGLRVHYDTPVRRIRREDGDFVVTAAGAEHRARRVVIATGVRLPNVPDIPGIELADQYADVSVDPDEFTGQRVLVIGKANSAFETADNLIASAAVVHVGGPGGLKLAWRTHFVGHLRAVNNGILDTYQLKLQHAVLDGTVRAIRRDANGYQVDFAFSRADELVKTLRYDRVICATGFRFDTAIFNESARPALAIDGRFPAQTASWESVNVPGLYFAGTLTQMRDFKKSTSGFIHGFRYCVRALGRVLAERHHDTAWPSIPLPARTEPLVAAVLARVNRSSALYQQFGFLADVLTVHDDTVTYREEVPVDRFLEDPPADAFVVTLDYGPDHDKVDPFDASVARASQDAANDRGEGHYLHPIVRHYVRGELVATHHVTENLENEWDGPVHVTALTAFLDRELSPVGVA